MKITKNHILKNSRKFTTLKITKNRILKNNQKFTIIKITKNHILKNDQKFTIIKISNIASGQVLKIPSKKKKLFPPVYPFLKMYNNFEP